MRKLLLSLVLLATSVAAVAYASDVKCPLHTYASCYNTGQISPTGSGAHKWHCSCNDDVWVAR